MENARFAANNATEMRQMRLSTATKEMFVGNEATAEETLVPVCFVISMVSCGLAVLKIPFLRTMLKVKQYQYHFFYKKFQQWIKTLQNV